MGSNTNQIFKQSTDDHVIREDEDVQIIRSHKVGTLTLGISLIFFGVLFITNTFANIFDYEFILKLWPVIFIFLGFEILISYITRQKDRFIYDKGAIFLMILLTMFAICMACVELLVDYSQIYLLG